MRIKEDTARRLLRALGYENAPDYAEAMVVRRLEKIETDVPDAVKLNMEDEDLSRVMKAVMSATRRKEEITLIPNEAPVNTHVPYNRVEKRVEDAVKNSGLGTDPDPEMRKELKEAKDIISKFPALTARADRETEAGQRREEARRQARADVAVLDKTPKKSRKPWYQKKEWVDPFPGMPATAKRPHKEGTVFRTIFETLRDASEDDPVTKDDVLKVLVRKFPKKMVSALAITVNGFPGWLEVFYPFRLHQKGKHYWLSPKTKETE